MPARRGFSLVELMIVMTIVFILAGLAYPVVNAMEEEAETAAMALTVRRVRQEIWYHASVGDSATSQGGFPAQVKPTWFDDDVLPDHPITGDAVDVQEVSGGKTDIYPKLKSFRVPDRKGRPAGHTAWYNRSNGAFCLKVPHQASQEKVLARFYEVNAVTAGP